MLRPLNGDDKSITSMQQLSLFFLVETRFKEDP